MTNWKVHLTTFLIFLFAIGVLRYVWVNPKVVIYLILAVIALLAYGALYIIVKAKMDAKSGGMNQKK